MNLVLINFVLFRVYLKLEICIENYYCLVLKFYELYLLLINDYKYFVELFMYSK